MALPDISLAQFNRIASGDYNAGQIDFKTAKDGSTELVKINNHVWQTGKNNVMLSPERILEVKEAFQKYNWLDRLDVEKAVESLTRFADTVKTWKGLVAEATAHASAASDVLSAPMLGGFMQV